MKKEDIDFSRGDEDIVFLNIELDTKEISEKENPPKILEKKLEDEENLKLENCEIVGIFKNEVSLLLKQDAQICLNDEEVYP